MYTPMVSSTISMKLALHGHGLSTTKVVATDNTQTEISKRPRGNRCVINALHARKLFHCQLPADGSQALSRFAETNRCITYLPYPEKSTTFRVDRRLVAKREIREKRGKLREGGKCQ